MSEIEKLDERVRTLETSSQRIRWISLGVAGAFAFLGLADYVGFLAPFRAYVGHIVRSEQFAHVELGRADSFENFGESDLNWRPWKEFPADSTAYIGLERQVAFVRPFDSPPEVLTMFRLVNVHEATDVIDVIRGKDIDYDSRTELQAFTAHGIDSRLRMLHIICDVRDVTKDGFKLQIGIGLPSVLAKALDKRLTLEPNTELVDSLFKSGDVTIEPSKYSESDKYMANWHEIIGTVNVAWVAKQK